MYIPAFRMVRYFLPPSAGLFPAFYYPAENIILKALIQGVTLQRINESKCPWNNQQANP